MNKQPEERKTALQDSMFSVEKFEGDDNGEGLDTNSMGEQENNARTNKQEKQTPQDVIYDKRTAQQQLQQNQYEVGKADTGTLAAATGMTYMPSIRELGYLNETSLLRKDFKIRGVNGNAGQKYRLSIISLSPQINDGKAAGYSEKEIIAGVLKSMAIEKYSRNYDRLNSGKVNEVFTSTL